jgi:hypothetical protein
MFWTFLQLARLVLCITMLPLALLPTKLGWDVDNKFRHFDTVTTGLGALARRFPMALTVDWAWCITAGLGDVIAVLCFTAFTATLLWLGDREYLCLGASTTASSAIATFCLNLFELGPFALTEDTPAAFTVFSAARKGAILFLHFPVLEVARAST